MGNIRLPEKARTLTLDDEFDGPVCGIDEVGRGPLAGPVVAACVYIPGEVRDHPVWQGVTDSKKLTPKKREELSEIIHEIAFCSIVEISPQVIDRINIHHATLLGMKQAFEALGSKPEGNLMALVDGKFTPPISCQAKAIVKGDSLSLSIGAASIVAKVYRDRLMARLHQSFPYYGWNSNAGYGTPVHLEGIRQHGICEHHRRSFAPCSGA